MIWVMNFPSSALSFRRSREQERFSTGVASTRERHNFLGMILIFSGSRGRGYARGLLGGHRSKESSEAQDGPLRSMGQIWKKEMGCHGVFCETWGRQLLCLRSLFHLLQVCVTLVLHCVADFIHGRRGKPPLLKDWLGAAEARIALALSEDPQVAHFLLIRNLQSN